MGHLTDEISLKAYYESTATNGLNGQNETFIGLSSLVDLSFYDSNGLPITISKSKSPIEIWIPRRTSFVNRSFQKVDVLKTKVSPYLQFMPNSFNINSNNASIHIHIMPNDTAMGYLIILKFGYTPILNSRMSDFDYMKILCPNSSKNKKNSCSNY